MIDLQIWFKKKSVSRSDSYHKLFDSQKIKSKFCFTNAYVKIFFFVVCYLYLLFSVPSLASLYYLSSLSISFSLFPLYPSLSPPLPHTNEIQDPVYLDKYSKAVKLMLLMLHYFLYPFSDFSNPFFLFLFCSFWSM